MEAFRYLAPYQLWEPDEKGYFYLGALDDEPGMDQPVAVGCLIFRVQYDVVRDKTCQVATLKWLYIDESHRRIGIATKMLNEWKHIMSQAGIDAACLRLPKDQDVMRTYLEKNGFVFPPQTELICRMSLSDVCNKIRKVPDAPIPVTRLCEMREQNFMEGLVNLARQSEKLYASGYLLPRKDAYDQELSCATVEGGKLRTILLIQKQAEIGLQIVAFRSFAPNGKKELLALLKTAALRAQEMYSADMWLEFYCPDEQMKEVAQQLTEKCECYETCRGICTVREELPFFPGEALTYRVDSWTQSRLASLQRPTISQEAYITSLDEWTSEKTLAWGSQGEQLEQLLRKVQAAEKQEILASEYSLVYQVSGQVRAMLLVTGSPYAEMEDVWYVNDWYINGGKSYRELCYLLQQLFDRISSVPVDGQTVTFVCSDKWNKRLVEYLMEGAERGTVPQPAVRVSPELSMSAVRFQALTDRLAQAGVASVLMYPPAGAAYLEVYLQKEKQAAQKIRFTYESVKESERMAGFVLRAVSKEPIGVSADGRSLYLNEVREESLELDAEKTVQWMTDVLTKVRK